MAAPSKKILVFGATGVLGKVLVNALANTKKHFERIGIFTSVETAETKKELLDSFKSRGVDMIVGDLYNDNDVLEAYTGRLLLDLPKLMVVCVLTLTLGQRL